MNANMLINQETHPGIAFAYAAGLVTSLVARTVRCYKDAENRLLSFAASEHGCLAMNAILTLGAGIYTLASGGAPALAYTLICFGVANGFQSAIYGNLLRLNGAARNYALTACDTCMTVGFANLLYFSKGSPWQIGVGVVSNIVMSGVRTGLWAKNFNIHPDFLYADMIALAGATAYEAYHSGHPWIALSRVIAAGAISMLAGNRAAFGDGDQHSYIDIRNLPKNMRCLRAYAAQRRPLLTSAPK